MLSPRDDIRVEFTGRNLTKFGGIPLLRKFLIRFGVKEELESAVPIEKRDRRKGLRDWLGLHREEKKEEECKRKQRKKALLGQVCTLDRRDIGIIIFQARGRGKEPFLFMGMGSWRIHFV